MRPWDGDASPTLNLYSAFQVLRSVSDVFSTARNHFYSRNSVHLLLLLYQDFSNLAGYFQQTSHSWAVDRISSITYLRALANELYLFPSGRSHHVQVPFMRLPLRGSRWCLLSSADLSDWYPFHHKVPSHDFSFSHLVPTLREPSFRLGQTALELHQTCFRSAFTQFPLVEYSGSCFYIPLSQFTRYYVIYMPPN